MKGSGMRQRPSRVVGHMRRKDALEFVKSETRSIETVTPINKLHLAELMVAQYRMEYGEANVIIARVLRANGK